MIILYILTYVFNIIDLLFTEHWINLYGITTEANPIGVFMYKTGTMEAVKTAVIPALLIIVYILSWLSDNDFGHKCIAVCCVLYGAICVLHCLIWLHIKTL